MLASKLYGVDATIIIFVFVLYCIGLVGGMLGALVGFLDVGRVDGMLDGLEGC